MSDSNDIVFELIPSKSTKPAQLLSTSATVVEFKPKGKRPRTPAAFSPSNSKEDFLTREKASLILKETVTYCCGKGSAEPGFIADHTGDGLFAGYSGIVGGSYLDKACRSIRKLSKLMKRSNDVMTIELWSLASMARFILKESQEPGGEIQDDEMEYLKSFARLIERMCDARYRDERYGGLA